METADMTELVRALRRLSTPAGLEKLQRDHLPVHGHCPRCRTVSPCTIYNAAGRARKGD